MVVDAFALLHDLAFKVDEGDGRSAWLLRDPQGGAHLVNLSAAVENITAHTLRAAGSSGMLFVGRHATPGVRDLARAGVVDILTEEPPTIILDGEAWTVPEPVVAMSPRTRTARPAWIRWALQRALLTATTPPLQTELAILLRTSQQNVSYAIKRLRPYVTMDGGRLHVADQREFLEFTLETYPGPGGHHIGWYGIDSPREQAQHASDVAELLDASPLIAADVAADDLAPWKLPTSSKLYVTRHVDLADDGFVPAPLDEATLITSIPQDPTLWRLATINENGYALADPVIVAWELQQGTDVDSGEAAEHLKKTILGRIA